MKKFVQWFLVSLRLKTPHPKREYAYVKTYHLYNEKGCYLETLDFDLRNFLDLQNRLLSGQAYFLVFKRYDATPKLTKQNIIDRAEWVVVNEKVYAIDFDRYYWRRRVKKIGKLQFPVLTSSDELEQFIKI